MDKSEYARSINSYITEYIKFADTKAASAVTAMLVMSGGLFSLIKIHLNDLDLFSSCTRNIFLFFSMLLFLFCLFFILKSLHSAFNVFMPRPHQSTDALNSFPYIKTFSSHIDYLDKMRALAESDIHLEYSKHNWELSAICMEKYSHVGKTFSSFKLFLYSSAAFGTWVVVIKILKIVGDLK